jgi:ATP-dependent helicase/nuclease subunit B
VRARFLLGPAGSGKTFRCLAEIRSALAASQEGPPLVLVAPKQTTYQLERQLLADDSIPGYSRLRILSFERLAHFVFNQLGKPSPAMLDEEGRVMVLRALLARKRDDLKLFRASARLTGFAQQLSLVLRELQRDQQTPETLAQLASELPTSLSLAGKLHDLATLLREYLAWLNTHNLLDSDCLLDSAASVLREAALSDSKSIIHNSKFILGYLWLDGFAQLSPQEICLLSELVPHCPQATLTFCLDHEPKGKNNWRSSWSVVEESFEKSRSSLAATPGVEIELELLRRKPAQTRFEQTSALAHLEKNWAEPEPFTGPVSNLRLAACANPEAEAVLAAREVLRHIQSGGRYRDVTILVRNLESYHQVLERVLSRYEIPFFLDRRESVSHHPLAELTRSSLRTVAFQWRRDDWFAALKTGLVSAEQDDIDRLENEALARGWQGAVWEKPIPAPDDQQLEQWLARLHHRLLPPFQRLALGLRSCQNKPTGPQLADLIREFWETLNIQDQLESWAAGEIEAWDPRMPASVHTTVWDQANAWLDNVELAFADKALHVREWLPILDAGLANLSVGVIPPALDQVFIGAIDRSRNPDIRLAIVLGLNEGIFPAPPQGPALLTDLDRDEIENRGVAVSHSARRQLALERFFAYVACTRARERVVLTCASQDTNGKLLNPSPFLAHLQQLFPDLKVETVPKTLDWSDAVHPCELIAPLLSVSAAGPEFRTPRSDPFSIKNQKSKIKNTTFSTLVRMEHSTRNAPPQQLSLFENQKSKIENFSPPLSLSPSPSLPLFFSGLLSSLRHFHPPNPNESLSPELAQALYGPLLRTSVSRMERFAACPFQFFIHSGLRAEERKQFELDVKEQGSFQHEVLAFFHKQLHEEGKRWRDITPTEARDRIGRIAKAMALTYREGLLQTSDEARFTAGIMAESLQDFVEVLVGWMRQQYRFDPVEVELPFGEEEESPAWSITLPLGTRPPTPDPLPSQPSITPSLHSSPFPIKNQKSKIKNAPLPRLALYGRIDRIDLFRDPASGETFCVVLDYKSSEKQLDPLLVEYGIQLQLLTYLNVVRRWPDPGKRFGSDRLIPAGVFYVNLRGRYEGGENRDEALASSDDARKSAYCHFGRFDSRALRLLDSRKNAAKGDQFRYSLTRSGRMNNQCRDPLTTAKFTALLDSVEANFVTMGQKIFAGVATIDPYQKGSEVACRLCAYRSICRIDPWTHRYRVLRKLTVPH